MGKGQLRMGGESPLNQKPAPDRAGYSPNRPQVPTGGRSAALPATDTTGTGEALPSTRSLLTLQTEKQAQGRLGQELIYTELSLNSRLLTPGLWGEASGGALAERSRGHPCETLATGELCTEVPGGCRGPVCKTRGSGLEQGSSILTAVD